MLNLFQNGYYNLCEAIERGDKVAAQNLILNDADVNTSNERDNTPLHRAIMKFNDLEIIQMLLERGANVHVKNHHGYKPLHYTIQGNKMEAASLLIAAGALDGEDLDSFLIKPISLNRYQLVKKVTDHVAQHNPSTNLIIPLKTAISENKPMMIEAIIPHCAFSKPSDLYIPRELVMTCGPQSIECVELLAKWNFTIHPDSHHDEDFIYSAVENGHLPIVVHLLELIDVNMVNSTTGLNLLTIACLKKRHEIVEKLLQHNADVNTLTPSHNEIFIQLLPFYDIFHVLKHSYLFVGLSEVTCLHISVFNSDPMMTKVLLRYNAKIKDDPKLIKMMSIAVLLNNEEIVRILLDHGVNLSDISYREATILFHCLISHLWQQHCRPLFCTPSICGKDVRFNIAKLLLENGANIHLETPGNNLVFEAVSNGHRKIAQLFLDYKADIQYVNPDGDTLLHVAVKKNDVEFITSLVHTDHTFNPVDLRGDTPLNIAIKMLSLEATENLIKYGADVNHLDQNNQTPLTNAWEMRSYYQRMHRLIKLSNGMGNNPAALECANRMMRITQIIETLQMQVLKLSVAQLECNNQDLGYLQPCYIVVGDPWRPGINISLLKLQCQDEIGKMKTEIIDKITFYDLLRKDNRFPMRFIKNEEFQKNLEQTVWDEKFPLYIDIIRSRFREMKIRYKLENSARIHFRKNIFKQLPDECIDMVFSYLNIEELAIFFSYPCRKLTSFTCLQT